MRILGLLEGVKETQRIHSNLLNILLKKQQEEPESEDAPPDTTAFPLKSVEDLTAMDEKLKDPVFERSLVSRTFTQHVRASGASLYHCGKFYLSVHCFRVCS